VIRLLGSEWLRFRSRRLIKVLIIVGVIGIAVGVTLGSIASKRPTEQQLARAEKQYKRNLRLCIENRNQGYFESLPDGDTAQSYCRRVFPLEGFISSDELRLGDLSEYMQAASFIVVLVGLVSGASMVGASWQSGTITTILTWEPRRIRWGLARIAVSAAGAFAIAIALLTLFSLAIAAGSALRGSSTTPSGWLGDVAWTAVRIAIVTAIASAIGSAVAMIGRNTTAALGAVFVYMAVVESLVRGFRPGYGRFMLGDNLAAFVSDATLDVVDGREVFALTPGRGAVVAGVYALVLTLVALGMLRTRDVL
jgi:ABC-2 type transport system permease protein